MGLGAWSGRPPASLSPALALATPRSSYQPACLPVCPASPVTASHSRSSLVGVLKLAWSSVPGGRCSCQTAASPAWSNQPGSTRPTSLARCFHAPASVPSGWDEVFFTQTPCYGR
jgi:hypothetical protein